MLAWLKKFFSKRMKPTPLRVDQLLTLHLSASGFKDVRINLAKSIHFPDSIVTNGCWKNMYFFTVFVEDLFLNNVFYRDLIVEDIITTLNLKIKKKGKL